MTENEMLKQILQEVRDMAHEQSELKMKVETHVAKDEWRDELLARHERILAGQNGDAGLPEQIRNNTEAIRTFKRIGWTIITPLLLAIGAGIVFLIAQSGA